MEFSLAEPLASNRLCEMPHLFFSVLPHSESNERLLLFRQWLYRISKGAGGPCKPSVVLRRDCDLCPIDTQTHIDKKPCASMQTLMEGCMFKCICS